MFFRCLLRALLLGFLTGTTSFAAEYELDLHLHSAEVTPAEFGAGDALLPVVAAAKTNRPAGSNLDFIGVSEGSPMWLLPKNQNASVLFLSVGTEELDPADFASLLTWSLVGVTGSGGGAAPGFFSVWNSGTSGAFSNVVPLMSTASGTSTPNAFAVPAGAHTHFNYGFTAPGLYNVTFAASGTLSAALGGGTATGQATYSFGVFDTGSDYVFPTSTPWTYEGQQFSVALVGNEHIDMGTGLAVVPEPSVGFAALLAAAGGASLLVRRQGRKSPFFRKHGRAG